MAYCNWCGKYLPNGVPVWEGGYCSSKCKHDAKVASERQKETETRNRRNVVNDSKSENLGCLGRIWRIIKIIIGVIVGLLILCYILS